MYCFNLQRRSTQLRNILIKMVKSVRSHDENNILGDEYYNGILDSLKVSSISAQDISTSFGGGIEAESPDILNGWSVLLQKMALDEIDPSFIYPGDYRGNEHVGNYIRGLLTAPTDWRRVIGFILPQISISFPFIFFFAWYFGKTEIKIYLIFIMTILTVCWGWGYLLIDKFISQWVHGTIDPVDYEECAKIQFKVISLILNIAKILFRS